MNPAQLRQKYPKFIFDKYSWRKADRQLLVQFHYAIPPDHQFTHQVSLENCNLDRSQQLENFIFHLGLVEMFSYWKTTCSPQIDITTGSLDPPQTAFWHKLFIKGMGEYFYQNRIDFTPPDFLALASSGPRFKNTPVQTSDSVLVPLGGGQDSIVTAELVKPHFPLRPAIVYPTTSASLKIARKLSPLTPVIVYRRLDPYLLKLTGLGYLAGHIPYSAALSFIFLLVAALEGNRYVAVSNERSADEGNVGYLGQTVNHQYSKTGEYETDLADYKSRYLTPNVHYFSFLRPLYELQIAKLFAHYPQYFPVFKSCNRNQRQQSWCGRCPKCLSIALTLTPWVGQEQISHIMGTNPLTDPANRPLLQQMTDPEQTKPFECIVSTEEAQICLELIAKGNTPRTAEFLARWQDNPNLPPKFSRILKHAYTHS